MKDILDVSLIKLKKENIINRFIYNDIQFILYHDEDDGVIVVIEISPYNDDRMEDNVEFYRIMNIVLYKDDSGDMRISYTAYKSHSAPIKTIEEADAFVDDLIDVYSDEFEEWYEKYFKGKEN